MIVLDVNKFVAVRLTPTATGHETEQLSSGEAVDAFESGALRFEDDRLNEVLNPAVVGDDQDDAGRVST